MDAPTMDAPKKVSFYTLGCKLNYSETSTIGRLFSQAGYQITEFHEGADIYVINTCSVTENADKKCRKVVREALKASPDAYVAVIGCFAQLKPVEISGIPGVDLVLGAAEKFRLLDHIGDVVKKPKARILNSEVTEASNFIASWSAGDRTRSFLKVQDGCDYTCSFCTIPLARGRSRSDTIENIVRSAESIAASGVREIVLTGVNIGDFGKGQSGGRRQETHFYDLVKALDKVEGIDRFRISSIEPNLLSDEIIEFVASSKRFVPHFHIPLQSGTDKILSLMRRRYRTDLYANRVSRIKSLMPHCCIGVDVIVGFPGESREDFLETYKFINELDVSYLHVFTYSERDNTHALSLPGTVEPAERAERSRMLHILSEKKRRHFYGQHLGSMAPVLFEGDCKDGRMHGFTPNYIKVRAKYDPLLVNELKVVKLVEIADSGEVEITEPEEVLIHEQQ
ncbi:tRNA (N(6)-L-threonylcarbamoyladenosine(37)-C(2))-methylthiotransferase MtaB [Anseongella ginsenosidimutans]|nr:tRNA (N(6)-L-threonylcarbamoyladenosine(37)-C(2))-methylthiotransferase MtaB [Anseongella ginsenosidimutans]